MCMYVYACLCVFFFLLLQDVYHRPAWEHSPLEVIRDSGAIISSHLKFYWFLFNGQLLFEGDTYHFHLQLGHSCHMTLLKEGMMSRKYQYARCPDGERTGSTWWIAPPVCSWVQTRWVRPIVSLLPGLGTTISISFSKPLPRHLDTRLHRLQKINKITQLSQKIN